MREGLKGQTGIGGLSKLSEGIRVNTDMSETGASLTRGPNQRKKLNNSTWTNTFPAQDATLDLDFANDRGFVRGVGQGKSMDAVTFTRASNGNYVKPDGTLSRHSNQGSLGNNLLTFPQDFDNAVWSVGSLLSFVGTKILAPDGTSTAYAVAPTTFNVNHRLQVVLAITLPTGTVATHSIHVKSTGTTYNKVALIETNSGAMASFDISSTGSVITSFNAGSITISNSTITDVGNGWFRISTTFSGASPQRFNFEILPPGYTSGGSTTWVGDGVSSVLVWGAQLEVGSTLTEYFATNINTPRLDWASATSTGAGTAADPRIIPLAASSVGNGLLIEQARTNNILWCRDATQTNWTKTNVTAAKNQTGVDGVANSASSLTSTAGNGTCIQTITLSSASYTGSVYLKRITGTGTIQVTLDGGTTYSTVELSASEWRRIVFNGTVTNPTIGIRIATSGDAVAMDYAQVESGAGATSPILTTTATVTRSADVASVQGINFYNCISREGGTIKAIAKGNSSVVANTHRICGIDDPTLNYEVGAWYTNSGPSIYAAPSYIITGLEARLDNLSTSLTVGQTLNIAFSFGHELLQGAAGGVYGKNLYQYSFPVGFRNNNMIFAIGNRNNNSVFLTGTISRVLYTPKRQSLSGLQDLTSDAT